jgi:hypothetical protein
MLNPPGFRPWEHGTGKLRGDSFIYTLQRYMNGQRKVFKPVAVLRFGSSMSRRKGFTALIIYSDRAQTNRVSVDRASYAFNLKSDLA